MRGDSCTFFGDYLGVSLRACCGKLKSNFAQASTRGLYNTVRRYSNDSTSYVVDGANGGGVRRSGDILGWACIGGGKLDKLNARMAVIQKQINRAKDQVAKDVALRKFQGIQSRIAKLENAAASQRVRSKRDVVTPVTSALNLTYGTLFSGRR